MLRGPLANARCPKLPNESRCFCCLNIVLSCHPMWDGPTVWHDTEIKISQLANHTDVCMLRKLQTASKARPPVIITKHTLICKTGTKTLEVLDKQCLLSDFGDPLFSLSLFLFHRYIADRWACCLCQAAVHHSCWIIHVLRRRRAERDRPYKAKLIKVVVLKVCLCLFQEERKERSAVIPFLSPCLYRLSPRLSPSLASLIPLFPRLSQENYNLTAHFNISASKWVWQALLCVVLSPTTPPSPLLPVSLPQSIHPPHSLSPCPNLLVSFAHRSPNGSTFNMWQEREKNKNKSGSNRGLSARLSGCLSLSPGEFHDTYVAMNLQWGEVSLHPDVRHSHSGLGAHRRCFRVTERVVISSTETDMNSE